MTKAKKLTALELGQQLKLGVCVMPNHFPIQVGLRLGDVNLSSRIVLFSPTAGERETWNGG
jgi:hypothetical protein